MFNEVSGDSLVGLSFYFLRLHVSQLPRNSLLQLQLLLQLCTQKIRTIVRSLYPLLFANIIAMINSETISKFVVLNEKVITI